jgi:hypothetical protein
MSPTLQTSCIDVFAPNLTAPGFVVDKNARRRRCRPPRNGALLPMPGSI